MFPAIIKRFPTGYQNMIYVEVFGGGGSVLLNKERSVREVLNDANGKLINLYRVVREHPEELKDRLLYVMHNREDFKIAQRRLAQFSYKDDILRAADFYQVVRQSYAGNGKQFSAVARSMWAGFPAIDRVAGRLQGVTLEKEDFGVIFQRYDSPTTVFYIDPPYVFTEDYYPGNIFLRSDHQRLAAILLRVEGLWLLSYLPGHWQWDKARVKRLLDNAKYTGEGNFPPIIKERDFQMAHQKKESANTNRQPMDEDIKLFKGLAHCHHCGGIGVVFEKEAVDTRTMNSELILAFHSAFSQSESESIRENVSRGLRMAYAQGTITLPATAYGFRKGEDNGIAIDPEQAQVVRSIYQMFLDGHGLRTIKERLEARQIPSPKGKEQWSVATIRSILSNEKYKGDVLLQKTYRPSLFSEKAVVNRGELAKYYIAGALPQIVESQMFDRAQEELAKRVSKRPASEKAKTPFGKYSGKYALTGVVVCGKCGAFYRRITWHHHGKVQVVWRCGARQDKAANCPDSPTLEENKLQSAVMEAISQQYVHKGETIEVTMQSIRSVLTPETAESEFAIRSKINDLQKERKALLTKALSENDDGKYDFQFLRIKRELEQLQSQLEGVQSAQKSQTVDEARMAEIAALLEQFRESDLPFDNVLVRKVVDTVRVESAARLEVTFKDGNRRVIALGK